MSFEPREYLRHIVVESDYLIGHSGGLSPHLVWDVVMHKIPVLRGQIAEILDAG